MLDPVSIEILWSRIASIVGEAAKVIVRTSFSTLSNEANDFACVLTDAHGRSIAQNTGSIPSSIGTLPATVRHFLTAYAVKCALLAAVGERGRFASVLFFNGGAGGRPSKDRANCLSWPSNISSTPIEIAERNNPIVFNYKRLRPGSGGDGRRRGTPGGGGYGDLRGRDPSDREHDRRMGYLPEVSGD